MTVKHPSLDYKPLRRTTPSKSVAEDDAGTELHFKRRETAATFDESNVTSPLWSDAPRSTREKRSELEPAGEKWIHKHGHSLSYAGIFLFTMLVFFRPYEWSPSLSWLSSSAFWIALLTLLVYALAQLGLENNLTARPREVNLVLLLTLTGALSIPLALEPSRAFASFFEFLKVVAIFIVMVNVIRTETRLKALWLLVLVATCILSISAINDYRLGRLALQGVRIKGSIGGWRLFQFAQSTNKGRLFSHRWFDR
jgi:hypothetical protein